MFNTTTLYIIIQAIEQQEHTPVILFHRLYSDRAWQDPAEKKWDLKWLIKSNRTSQQPIQPVYAILEASQ